MDVYGLGFGGEGLGFRVSGFEAVLSFCAKLPTGFRSIRSIPSILGDP